MNVSWLTPEWPVPRGVNAVTTLRGGGVSTGAFVSLNTAMHVGDNPRHVEENRRRIKTLLKLPAEPVWLQQVHGTRVLSADTAQSLETADASFSTRRGVVCVALTADCLPVLLCTQSGSAVAAVHAGWRGLLDGVIENTVAALPREPLLAWLGPAIGPQSFEVGPEVRAAFTAKAPCFGTAFVPKGGGKWLADIYLLGRLTLEGLGVNAVYGGGYCTVSDAERFFSYRRDSETGRMASLIWID